MRSRSDRPRSFARTVRIGLTAGLLLGVLAGCRTQDWPRWGFPRGITKQAHQMLGLWNGAAAAALIVGVFVWTLILWSSFRYRKRGDDLPPQVRYNLPIETLYTIVPFLIIAVLFFYTAVTQSDVTKVQANPDVRVNVTGFQWNWKFGYADERDRSGQLIQTIGTSEQVPILVLPVNQRVVFRLRSEDVVHSFWVPEFLFKRDVIPGRLNQFQVTITRQGAFVGRCAELCGTYHSMMNFELRSVSGGDFQRYLDARRRGLSNANALKSIGLPGTAVSTRPYRAKHNAA